MELTRKQRSAAKRAGCIEECKKYFLSVLDMNKPNPARIVEALEKTEAFIESAAKQKPQEHSFWVDVKIEFRDKVIFPTLNEKTLRSLRKA